MGGKLANSADENSSASCFGTNWSVSFSVANNTLAKSSCSVFSAALSCLKSERKKTLKLSVEFSLLAKSASKSCSSLVEIDVNRLDKVVVVVESSIKLPIWEVVVLEMDEMGLVVS